VSGEFDEFESDGTEADFTAIGAPATARKRRRRRVAQVVGSVAAVCVLGLAGVALSRGGGSEDKPGPARTATPQPNLPGRTPSAGVSTSAVASPTLSPAPSPTFSPTAASSLPPGVLSTTQSLPGSVVAPIAIALFPSGITATLQSDPQALFLITDGRMKSTVVVDVNPAVYTAADFAEVKTEFTCPGTPGLACTASTLADGTLVLVEDTPTATSMNAAYDMVDVIHPSGMHVTVSENADQNPPKMLLTLAQMKAIALDPQWMQLK
jgi:hypothetical protein